MAGARRAVDGRNRYDSEEMTYKRIAWVRLSALIIAFLVLGSTGLIGVYNPFVEWRSAHTVLQKSVTASGALYGIVGLIAAIGLLLRKKWSVRFAVAWGILVTYSGSAAVTAYGQAPNAVSATFGAFVGCLAISALVVWLTKVGSRQIVSYDK